MSIRAIHTGIFYLRNTRGAGSLNTNSYASTPLSNLSGAPIKDIVSFKRFKPETNPPEEIEKPYTSDMRELELHCACCGHMMVKNKTVNSFLNRKIYFPASVALDRIKHEQNFRVSQQSPTMQSAYSYIKRKANERPWMTMNELTGSKSVLDDLKNSSRATRQALNRLREMCNIVTHDSSYMVREIENLNPDFQSTEAAAFQELKMYAKMYPEESIYNILNKPEIKEYYLGKLQNKQNTKLRKVTPLIQQLSPQIAKKAGKALNRSYKIFNVESSDILHKRGRVFEVFQEVFDQIPETNTNDQMIAKLIMKRLEALPDSRNDLNSLMIKGSQKTSNAFVELLVARARNTNEHVKPHHRKGDNGESNYSNYISLCGKCNGERKREKYDEFIDKHPWMIENTQKQIDEVCDYINKGIFVEHDTWPKDIKEPLATESEGKLVINYDKLDIQKAKENRTKRTEAYIESQKNKPSSEAANSIPMKRNPRK